jgi:NAD(P)-dependent dehydrogenase (short-subunit alcohol dehydrogenase family)
MLLDRNCRVAAIDLTADSINTAFPDAGSRLHAIAADIGDHTQCWRAVAESVSVLGSIDAFLHFAAIWVGTPWDRSEPPEWDRVICVNVKGTFFLTQAVARHMTERGRGAIVLTTSDSVNVGSVAGGPAYVASKGAIVGLTHSFAKSLAWISTERN